MLGPMEDQVEGSPAWAMRLGARLQYQMGNIDANNVDKIIDTVRKAVTVQPRPWTVWPTKEAPCGSVDSFFALTSGLSVPQYLALIDGYRQDHDLARLLHAAGASLRHETDGQPPPTWPERVPTAWSHCTPEERAALRTALSE